MPAVSQAQRAYLNAKFGHAWVKKHHFDNPGKLPTHVGKKKRRKRGRVNPDARHRRAR
jgi:hypothetical protein